MPRAELLTLHTARRCFGNFMATNNVPVKGTERFRSPFETKTVGICHYRPEAAALDRAQQAPDKGNTPPAPCQSPVAQPGFGKGLIESA